MATPPPPPAAEPPEEPADASGFSDSDRVWFEHLTQPSAADAASATPSPPQREADTLRLAIALDAQALDRDPAWAQTLGDAGQAAQWQRLVASLPPGLGAAATPPAPPAAAAPAPHAPPSAAPTPSPAPRPRQPAPGAGGRWRGLRWPTAGGAMAWPRWGGAASLAGVALALALAYTLVRQPGADADIGGPPLARARVLRGEGDRVQQLSTRTPRRDAEALAQALRTAGLNPGVFAGDGGDVVVDVVVDEAQLAAAQPVFTGRGLRSQAGFSRVVFGPGQGPAADR